MSVTDIGSIIFSIFIVLIWLLMWPMAILHEKYCERPPTQDDHTEEPWTQLSFSLSFSSSST